MKLRNNVLLPHQDSSHRSWGFTYIQDNIGLVSMTLNSTTVLARQHVSSVSYSTARNFKRMYNTYSLYVVPRATDFSCVDTQMSTHRLSPEAFTDLKYIVNVHHICGAGVYNDKGNYLFWFTVHSITLQMLFLQVIPSLGQHSNNTNDVLVACPDATNCYAVDLFSKDFICILP